MISRHRPVAIVTGGSGGIGEAIVANLLKENYIVVSLGRSEPQSPLDSVEYLKCDVSIAAQVNEAVLGSVDKLGRLDVLVTTAGVLHSAPVHLTTDETWDEIIGTNLTGVFYSCRAALPAMIAAGSGSIVNLSSVHAVATVPGAGAYAASKGAVVSLSRQMAVEYADAGIRVNSLVVGSVDTKMTTRHKALLSRDGVKIVPPPGQIGRMALPDEIAKAVIFLAGNGSSFVTGSAITVDGGLLSVLI